jgi:hypothetical protein
MYFKLVTLHISSRDSSVGILTGNVLGGRISIFSSPQRPYRLCSPPASLSNEDWAVSRRFGGTCRFILKCRRISQARNQPESRWQAKTYIPEGRTFHNHRCENLRYCSVSHHRQKSFNVTQLVVCYLQSYCVNYIDCIQTAIGDNKGVS